MLEGGEKMVAELKNILRSYPNASASAGFYDPDSASLAFYMEYGFKNARTKSFVPPRPFMRIALERYEVRKAISEAMWTTIQAGGTSADAMENGCKALAEAFRQGIRDSIGLRGNRPYTVKRKGFDHPLLETGWLYEQIRARRGRVRGGEA